MKQLLILLVLLLAFPVLAQESASYKLAEHTFNAGGNPSDGVVLTSTSYSITLDAIGDSVVARGLSSASFGMDGGFISGYPPPGEVDGLYFTDPATLVWSPEPSACPVSGSSATSSWPRRSVSPCSSSPDSSSP